MTLTALDRMAVRQSFDRAAGSYDQHAVLQAEVAARLLERLDYFAREAQCVLDLGCGTGQPGKALAERFPEAAIISLDWAPAMLAQALHSHWRSPPGGRIHPVCADMQRLPLAPRSVDLVFSNLAVQWSNDLPQLFAGLRRVLRPGGLLVFSTFGPDTLHELRAAWAHVDSHPHVNRYMDMHDIGDQLVAAGFRDPVMDAEPLVLRYRQVLDLMRDLKGIGAHNAAAGRPPGLTGKATLQRVIEAYQGFERGGFYPATYEVLYGVAFGPAEGQPVRTGEGEIATFSVDALRSGSR